MAFLWSFMKNRARELEGHVPRIPLEEETWQLRWLPWPMYRSARLKRRASLSLLQFFDLSRIYGGLGEVLGLIPNRGEASSGFSQSGTAAFPRLGFRCGRKTSRSLS